VSIDHAATYPPEAATGLTVHTSDPFVPLPSLCMQLDLPSPVTMFASPHCATELYETFRIECRRICWWQGKLVGWGAALFCHGGRQEVTTKRDYTMLPSCKEPLVTGTQWAPNSYRTCTAQ
jgi:hypothetical protein